MATLRDIAQELGLSISTVSRALNGHPHIDERTRQRVQRAAKKQNYQPNALARALRWKQTKVVGLIIPDILNRFYASGATVLQETLEREGYRLIVCISNDDPQSDRSYLNALLQQRVDGIVHVPCTPEGAQLVREAATPVPVVELNRCSATGAFDAVICDDYDGAFQVTKYLIGLGHTRIGAIAGPEALSTTRARTAGYREALRQAGIPIDDDDVQHRDYSRSWGYEAVQMFVERRPRPTAIFATGNQVTLGALHALSDLGLRVPDDISLAGFDDPEWFSAWRPGITTYALPLGEMGLLAAQLLLSRMTSPAREEWMPTITRLSGRLIVRTSCAAPFDLGPEQQRSAS